MIFHKKHLELLMNLARNIQGNLAVIRDNLTDIKNHPQDTSRFRSNINNITIELK